LHDEEIWVVDVELDGLEELLDGLKRRLMSVEEILGEGADSNLSRKKKKKG
jgi:hypothetical protein